MGPAQEMKFKMERQSRNMTTLASFQSDKKKERFDNAGRRSHVACWKTRGRTALGNALEIPLTPPTQSGIQLRLRSTTRMADILAAIDDGSRFGKYLEINTSRPANRRCQT